MKRFFNKHHILSTLFIFVCLGLLSLIPVQSDLLNPVSAAFDDFELTDVVFSKLRPDPPADTNIVIVNIRDLNRAGVAEQINIINRYRPKVVAVDAAYRQPKDAAGDSALAKAFAEVDNLVLVSGMQKFNEQTGQYDTLETSHAMFNQHAVTGFANMIIEDNDVYKVVRTFSPKEKICGKTELAFFTKIAQVYKPEAAEKFLKRNNGFEIINYKGNYNKFYTLDVDDIFDPDMDLSFIEGKIVLMGFIGDRIGARTLEDKFYTPLNENYIGRAHPDMFGVVIHANATSMILREEYINEVNDFIEIVIAVALCFINVAFFTYIINNLGDWYDSITILTQLIEACLIGYTVLVLFDVFGLKINLTLALAAVLISSNVLEIYYHIVIRIYSKRKSIKVFKLKKQTT